MTLSECVIVIFIVILKDKISRLHRLARRSGCVQQIEAIFSACGPILNQVGKFVRHHRM